MEKKEKSPLEILAENEKSAETALLRHEENSDKYSALRRKVTFAAILSILFFVLSVFMIALFFA